MIRLCQGMSTIINFKKTSVPILNKTPSFVGAPYESRFWLLLLLFFLLKFDSSKSLAAGLDLFWFYEINF